MKKIVVLLCLLSAFFSINGRPALRAEDGAVQYGKLIGRWVRLDGGYVFLIRDVYADGRLQASYLNPKPIKIVVAEVSVKDGDMNIFIEFEGTGDKPGSYYTLVYDPDADKLTGVYHYAALDRDYDVSFERFK